MTRRLTLSPLGRADIAARGAAGCAAVLHAAAFAAVLHAAAFAAALGAAGCATAPGRAAPPPIAPPVAQAMAAPALPAEPRLEFDDFVQVIDISAEASATTEPSAYRLTVGDMVKIIVVGQADLSLEVLIPPRGELELPVIGTLPLLGRTTQEVSEELRTKLDAAGFLVQPEVSCSVSRFAPRLVFVVEGVERPEAYEIPIGGSLHLTQVLALAGGLSAGADPSQVTILRRPPDGTPQRLRVNLRAILDSDRFDLDPLLLPDDTVLVRDVKQGEEQVFVAGKVRTPGAYRFSPREGITFLQAIILAGGLDKYAKPSGAALMRRTPAGRITVAVDLARLLAGELERDLPLQSGDVVFIPESFF